MKKLFFTLLIGISVLCKGQGVPEQTSYSWYHTQWFRTPFFYLDSAVLHMYSGTLVNTTYVANYVAVHSLINDTTTIATRKYVQNYVATGTSANALTLQGHAASYFSVKTNTDSLNLIDTFYFSSANIIAGDSVQLYSATTGTNRRIINNIVIDYRYNSPVYASTGADSIFICAKYKSKKVKLIYIADSYITDAYSGYGCLMPTLGKLDANTVFWIKIPHIYSNGKGVLRLRLSSKIVKF
jgi:hypothetical protein